MKCTPYLDLEIQLKNAVFKELLQVHSRGGVALSIDAPPTCRKEPLAFVAHAQEEWEAKVRRGVNALCTERGLLLARQVSVVPQLGWVRDRQCGTVLHVLSAV